MRPLKTIATSLVVVIATAAALRLAMWWSVEQIAFPESDESGIPRLQLVTAEQDIGRVGPGGPLQVTFCVANAGTGRLTLREASRDSSAGQLLLSTHIEPGHTGELVFPLDPEELAAFGSQQVRFDTNDPSRPEVVLTVRGSVVGPTPAAGDGDWPAALRREESSVLIRRP
jgi:hypothetical protein